jgi:hypothetical protein
MSDHCYILAGCLCFLQVRVTHAHGPPVYDASDSSSASPSSNGSSSAKPTNVQQQDQVEKPKAATSEMGASCPRAPPLPGCSAAAATDGVEEVPLAAPATTPTATAAASTQKGSNSLQELAAADPASPQAVKSMSCDEILHKWRSLLGELGAVLVALQDAPAAQNDTSVARGDSSSSSSSACEQLEELTERSKQLLGTAMVLNPGDHADVRGCPRVAWLFLTVPSAWVA